MELTYEIVKYNNFTHEDHIKIDLSKTKQNKNTKSY